MSGDPTPTAERTSGLVRARGVLSTAAPALGVYAAVRLACLLAVVATSWVVGRHPRSRIAGHWDALWYQRIARSGYGVMTLPDEHGVTYTDLAFFPLYPGLQRAVSTVLPIGAANVGLLVAWVSAAVACLGIFAVGAHLYGRRVGIVLVVLWGLLPNAVVETMAYSESSLTAFAAWSLYAVLTRRWLWAGFLSVLAGLTRPNGIAVAAAVGCAAAVALWRDPGCRRDPRVWAAPVLAPLGWLGYIGWAGLRAGSPTGYFDVQRVWGSRFDFGHWTLWFGHRLATREAWLSQYAAGALLIAAVVALVLLVLDRPPFALLAYTGVLMAIALGGSNYFASRPRFLLPAFPLLIPAALALARARPLTRAVLTGGLAGISVCYGAYLVVIAPTAP
ncbi:hypothetical protein [Streptomyces sp. TS71-3]|uniref:hypothetical protein n=1 Tax=Streptomyces sp. TS71-3 TaxID=2733862 RepID=UPI001B204DF7|nr:hypothetical protein [Streptomyces sp. TS71-3]GHJ41387.1 membrane protein [Streptomyces sp. TS71-3]